MAEMLTPAEIAEKWGCTPKHIQRLAASGRLRAMKLGRRGWRISPSALAAYEAAQTSGEQPAPPAEEVQTVIARPVAGAPRNPVFPALWNLPDGYERAASQRN